ncbi:PAS domain-containing protein [Alteromonas mediterranea]|uniref:PAS domain-containing protein n=1 Tax=Alteromonas mediterranea TaxID=314275 RepID=UPI0003FFC199|nr:PAS domain-containing protein [Alteromonas mediterranea]MBR9785582.1 PAS domain-containing protein [Gammaproteobacteria bacterium]
MPERTCGAASSITNDILFQALIENITDTVILADVKGDVIYANPKAREICGLHKSENFHCSIFSLFPEAQVPNINRQFEHAAQ